jgi:hypothetical protein
MCHSAFPKKYFWHSFFSLLFLSISIMAENKNASDLYKVIRGQIENQNDALNQRVIWLVIAQSFFFSGYAIMVTGNPAAEPMKQIQHYMLYVFPIASLLILAVSYIDILCGLLYLTRLRKHYDTDRPKEDEKFPPIAGWENLRHLQYASPVIIPVILFFIWAFILMQKI